MSRRKILLTEPERDWGFIVLRLVLALLWVLILVALWTMALSFLGHDPLGLMEDTGNMTATELTYRCPMCGDWCDRLFVDNRGTRNPEDAKVPGERRLPGPPIGCLRCLSTETLAAKGGSPS
jgi:hypothetical protein